MKIFIFGSLLSQEVLDIVLGGDLILLNKIPFTNLPNYKAKYVQDESYPMLIQSSDNSTVGKVINIESNDHLDRLTFYEGDENPLVLVSKKESLYAFVADSTLVASTKDWSYENWYQSTTHTLFLTKVQSYMSHFNKESEAIW